MSLSALVSLSLFVAAAPEPPAQRPTSRYETHAENRAEAGRDIPSDNRTESPPDARPGGPRITLPTATSTSTSTEVRADRSWRITGDVVTDFPVFLGAEITLELPGRFLFGTGIGGVPNAYLSATTELVTALADLDGPETEVVTESLSGSWVARVFIGWRPAPRRGFFIRLGYAAVNLSGRLDDATSIALVTGLPRAAAAGGAASLDSTLHGLEAMLGYRWVIDGLSIRVGLGMFATLGAAASISVDSPLNPNLTAELARLGEDYLEDIYRSYVFTPSLGVGVGYDLEL